MVKIQAFSDVKVNGAGDRASGIGYQHRPPLKDRVVLAAARRIPTVTPPDGGPLPLIRPSWNRLPLPSRILLAGFAVYCALLALIGACIELARLA